MPMMRHILLTLAAMTAALAASAATVDTLDIASSHLDSPMRVAVIVPEAAKADTAARFPSVYLLNGYSGDYRSWTIVRPDLDRLADQYGMIIVMPDGRDSWYWDSRPGMEMESFFTDDLVPYIDRTLPTVADRDHRAISGLSMGGHGAMWLAMRHSDLWGSAASMSGGLDIRPFASRWKMQQLIGDYKNDPAGWDAHTVITLVPELKPGQLNLLIDCGVDDFFIDVNRNMHQALLDAKIQHDYTERPGGHSRQYWANSVLYHLVFFDEAFKAAK